MLITRKLRALLPDWLSSWYFAVSARTPPILKAGPHYWLTRALLRRAGAWTEREIETWQLQRLNRLLGDAFDHVPGYRHLYSEYGIGRPQLSSLREIGSLPMVTKEMMRDNLTEFTSRRIPSSRRLYVTTGGSTGVPFGFYWDLARGDVELAFVVAAWELAGFRRGARTGVLRGGFVGDTEHLFNAYNTPLYRGLEMSSYFLTERTYPRYRDATRSHRLEFLHVYPSAVTQLATLILEQGDQEMFSHVRGILTASENLYAWQRELIQRAFPGARLFDFYGHSERAAFASWCETSDCYHSWPLYGVLEVTDGRGTAVAAGQTGEIVATSLWNRATPFIRYRTMDSATYGGRQPSCCARPWPFVTRLDGRLQEMVVTATGRLISMTAINMHDECFDDVRQFQFLQERPGEIVLKLMPKPSFCDASLRIIELRMKEKLGADSVLTLELVDAIPRTPAGKLRFLDQRIENVARLGTNEHGTRH